MHRSTLFGHNQSLDWKNVTIHLNQDILCNVGTGWSSLARRRVGNWPFWSHYNFLFGLVWMNVRGAICSYMLPTKLSHYVSFLARLCSAFSQLSGVE